MVHLARNLGTPEGEALAKALLGAVKYNRTSADMTNAYGLSIWPPAPPDPPRTGWWTGPGISGRRCPQSCPRCSSPSGWWPWSSWYIQCCAGRYPASRYALILWDHGGGSVSGYGYDEKFASTGSMDLAGLDRALGDGGVKFDFIGFDACLMATAETALTMAQYADYLIASEETEPGVGWYYTDWLTALGEDPSMLTALLTTLFFQPLQPPV